MEQPLFPKYLSIQTTSLCNASCAFCPYEDIKNTFMPKTMDMDLYKKIIDECKNYRGIERIILYMNNEPLTDTHLIERINYAKENIPWASVHFLTNGLLLTDKMTKGILNSKLDWMGISFHGIKKDTIENVMKIPFDAALSNINSFIEKARNKKNIKEYVMITFLGHKYLSEEEKKQTFDYWKKKGIERVSYFDSPVSRAGNVKDLPKIYHKGSIVGCKSIWADEMIHIVEDGKVVLCCMDWGREVILGDLNYQTICEVWNGKRKDVWQMIYGKKEMSDGFLCRKCEEAQKEKLDILLVTTPPWQTKMVPLGMAYLSQFLKSNGIRVKPIDLNAKLYNRSLENKKYFWDIATINSFTPGELAERVVEEFRAELDDFVNQVCDMDVKLVGFSTTIASTGIAIYLAHQIKQRDPSRITILGGPGCYWNTYILDPEKIVDMFVIGEGEAPLLEIVKRFKENNSFSSLLGIQGTVVCRDKEYLTFVPPNPIRNLDEIPFPEFSDFNLEEYGINEYRPIPILLSRGCINKCSFCIDHKMNFPYRIKDPRKVLEEIGFYIERYGVRYFELNDLLCNGNLKQLEKICDLIIERNLNIKWTSYAIVREGMTLELYKKMHKAGCRLIAYGMESASDVVLRKMNKRYNAELAEKVIRNTRNAGIETCINIILGHPGESEKEFRKTCEFIRRNKEYIDCVTNVSSCFLMLDTDLIENLDKFGVYFKKTLRNHIGRILKRKKMSPNFRNYYVAPDNTPRARAKWFRRFLKLLYENDLPYVILNYVVEHDKNLDEFITRLKRQYCKTEMLDFRGIRIDLTHYGKCKLFCNGHELTKDVGMNTSFFVNGRWTDSSIAQWSSWSSKINKKSAEVDIQWPEAPIRQRWTLSFKGKYIDWRIRTFFQEKTKIYQNKIGIMVSNKYGKYMFNRHMYNFPDFITENWEEVMASKIPSIGLVADNLICPIYLKLDSKKDIFLQVQNAPFLSSRMVNFCLLESNVPGGCNKDGRLFDKCESMESRLKIYVK